MLDACKEEANFQYLYPFEMKLRDRVELIAKEVYGADGVAWTPEAEAKAKQLEADPKFADYATMMVKTHLSLSHDPTLKGVPKGWVSADSRCAGLFGREVPLPVRRHHQLDAWNVFQPRFPPRGCGCEDGEGIGTVLSETVGSEVAGGMWAYPTYYLRPTARYQRPHS